MIPTKDWAQCYLRGRRMASSTLLHMPAVLCQEQMELQTWRHWLYGHCLTVYTDHLAVKAVLETASLSGCHAVGRLESSVQGWKRFVAIVYCPGRDSVLADPFSCNPTGSAPVNGLAEEELWNLQLRTYLNQWHGTSRIWQMSNIRIQIWSIC